MQTSDSGAQKNFPFTIEPWSVVSEDKEYDTPIFTILKRRYRLDKPPQEGTFYIVDAPEWINILALTDDNQILLVEQYRYGIEEPTLEIPGGVSDEGEDPIEAARRELLEETGYVSDQWSSLGKVSSNPAFMTNATHFFLAEGCKWQDEQNLDYHEYIHLHRIPVEHFLDHVSSGIIHHSLVVAAVAKLLLKRPDLAG